PTDTSAPGLNAISRMVTPTASATRTGRSTRITAARHTASARWNTTGQPRATAGSVRSGTDTAHATATTPHAAKGARRATATGRAPDAAMIGTSTDHASWVTK